MDEPESWGCGDPQYVVYLIWSFFKIKLSPLRGKKAFYNFYAMWELPGSKQVKSIMQPLKKKGKCPPILDQWHCPIFQAWKYNIIIKDFSDSIKTKISAEKA